MRPEEDFFKLKPLPPLSLSWICRALNPGSYSIVFDFSWLLCSDMIPYKKLENQLVVHTPILKLHTSNLFGNPDFVSILLLCLGDILDDNDENGPAWSDRDYTYEEVYLYFPCGIFDSSQNKTLQLNRKSKLYVESIGNWRTVLLENLVMIKIYAVRKTWCTKWLSKSVLCKCQ